jgi:hypothetical protein
MPSTALGWKPNTFARRTTPVPALFEWSQKQTCILHGPHAARLPLSSWCRLLPTLRTSKARRARRRARPAQPDPPTTIRNLPPCASRALPGASQRHQVLLARVTLALRYQGRMQRLGQHHVRSVQSVSMTTTLTHPRRVSSALPGLTCRRRRPLSSNHVSHAQLPAPTRQLAPLL